MPSTAVQSKGQPKPIISTAAKPKPISWKAFQKKYLMREDGYKYEWVDGKIEKTKRAMDKSQLYILLNIRRLFTNLERKGKVTGLLISEPDLFFLKNHRRPDICWLTHEQVYNLADPKGYEVPKFVVEVISTNDQINKVKEKMKNYRDAGVKVVWLVFPILKEVEVYTGERLEKSELMEGAQVCSAAPVLPYFGISVNDIFYLPKVKQG